MVYTISLKESEASGKFSTSNPNGTGPGPSNINPLKVQEERDEERIELILIYKNITSLIYIGLICLAYFGTGAWVSIHSQLAYTCHV
jgi:hypothetical protein